MENIPAEGRNTATNVVLPRWAVGPACKICPGLWGPGQATPKYASMAYDYFELKLLKKWATQEGHSYSLFCFPESRKYISHVKGALPESGGTRAFLSPKIGKLGMRNLYKKTCDFFHGLKPKLCSDSL